MDYRDERDALRARVDSLESELATARAETDRMRATENALAYAQRENDKLRAELRRIAPRGKGPSVAPLVVIVAGSIACVGAAGFFVFARSHDTPPQPVVVGQAPSGEDERPGAPVEGPAPRPERDSSPRATTVEWQARVAKAAGLAFPAGTPCTVRATLRSDGSKAQSPDVEIACSGKLLYRSTDQLEGMSNSSYGADEVPGPDPGSYRATLQYQDQGTRTGARTQASVSTPERVAVAWKETAPTYRVELDIDELSTSWKGPALYEDHETQNPLFRAPIERRGHVESVRNNALVQGGAACTVRVFPVFGPKQSCRVSVRCGESLIYGEGGGGFNQCTVESGRVFAAKDSQGTADDKDPMLELSLPQGNVEVSDTGANAWSVKVRLDPEKN